MSALTFLTFACRAWAQPAAPTDLVASEAFDRGAVTLSWLASEGAETYEVWRGDTPAEESMSLLAGDISGETHMDGTAEFAVTYYYRVRARNASGVSPFSDTATGSQNTRRWIQPVDGLIESGPVLGDDGVLRLRVGSSSGRLLTAVNGVDGEIEWTAELEDVYSGPVVAPDGTTFMVYREHVVAFDPQGAVRWRTELPPVAGLSSPGEGAVALTGDGVLIACRQNTWMYGFDMDGALLWTTRLNIQSDPSIAVAADGSILVAGRPGVLLKYERNGLLRWEAPFPAPPRIAIAADGSIIGTGSGQAGSVSPAGTPNWTWPFGFGAAGAPVVAPDGTVYFADSMFRLSRVSADGFPQWSVPGDFTSSPTLLDDGTILIYEHNVLRAFDAQGTGLWAASLAPNLIAVAQPGLLAPAIATDGSIFCAYGSNVMSFVGTSPLAAAGWPSVRRDARHTGNLSGPAPAPGPLMDAAASQGTWVNQVRLQWATNGEFAFVDVWRSSSSNFASAVKIGEALPGQFEFRDRDLPAGETWFYWLRARNPAGTTPFVEVGSGYSTPDVDELWSHKDDAVLSTPALSVSGQIYATSANAELLALNRSGDVLWRFVELASPLREPAVAPDGTVYVHNNVELAAVNPNGSLRWKKALEGGAMPPLSIARDGSVYLAQNGSIRAIGPDGEDLWQIPTSSSFLALGPDDTLHSASSTVVSLINPNGTPITNFTQFTGSAGPPAIAADGTIFFPTSTNQLQALTAAGEPLYSFGRQSSNLREPVLGPGQLAFISSGSTVRSTHALNAQGEELWRFRVEATGLVADNSGGLILAHTNLVTSLDSEGAIRWQYEAADSTPSPPFLTESGLLCFAAGRKLVALQTALLPAARGWYMWRGDPQRTGRTAMSIRILNLVQETSGDWTVTIFGHLSGPCVIEESVDLTEWSTVLEFEAEPGVTSVPVVLDTEEPSRFLRVRSP